MKLLVTLLLSAGLSTVGFSAWSAESASSVSVVAPAADTLMYTEVEMPPQFPGGEQAMLKYLATHVMYPAQAAEDGAQGKVVVSFVVGKDGSISKVKVIRSKHPALDREAVRVVKAMPKWIPGKMNGLLVNVTYTLPVDFKLQ